MKFLKHIFPLLLCIMLFVTGCANGGAAIKNEFSERGFLRMKNLLSGITSADKIYEIVQGKLDEGKSLDLSGCNISVSKSLVLNNQSIFGGSIKYVGEDKSPVMKISGKCNISHTTLYNTCKSTEAKEGEYVGIWLSNDKGTVTEGTVIDSVSFGDTGTCVYAPADVEAAACGMTIENIRAMGFFRGIDIRAKGCKNNRFSNIYMDFITNVAKSSANFEAKYAYDNTPPADCAFYLENCENAVIKQLNVEHIHVNRPIVIENCDNLDISTLHIEGVSTALDNFGYLNISNTSGRIGAITTLWSRVYNKNASIIALGDADEGGNELEIENFHVRGIHDPASAEGSEGEINNVVRGIAKGNAASFKFMARADECKNTYYVTVNNYAPFTFQNDRDRYESFVSDTDTITFKKIGELPAGGTTAERPTVRLCAGYTKYFDTTLNELLLWDGKTWTKVN